MRRNRLESVAVEAHVEGARARRDDPYRGARRRVQWSTYYHHFFGRVRPGDRIPDAFAPISLDASIDTLASIYEPQRHDVAKRCMAQIVSYGHRAADSNTYDRLARAVCDSAVAADDSLRASSDAKTALRRWAVREFSPTSVTREDVIEEMRRAGLLIKLISLPTRMVHDRGAFLFIKDVYMRTTVDAVSYLVNPENWELLGDFFARTYRQGDEANHGIRPPVKWQGILHEDFVATWNLMTTSVFKQRLKIDYSVGERLARCDYALMYEQDDQVTVNEGFLDVRREEDLPPGWIAGTMQKKVRFTSSILNMLCPAMLSMLLDSNVGGFNEFIK